LFYPNILILLQAEERYFYLQQKQLLIDFLQFNSRSHTGQNKFIYVFAFLVLELQSGDFITPFLDNENT